MEMEQIDEAIIAKWNDFSISEKELVIALCENLNSAPTTIKEARWWNTVGDIVGIFDPTGVVDIINAVDYARQGDNIYALLSLISAIPYAGDLLAKPIIGVLKLGGPLVKLVKGANTSSKIAALGSKSPHIGKMLNNMDKIKEPLREIIKRGSKIPVAGGIMKTLGEWAELLFKGSQEFKAVGAKKSTSFRGFRDHKPSAFKGNTLWWGGVGRLKMIGGSNRATRALMRRSKWYLKLLETMGIYNTVDIETLEEKYGTKLLEEKISAFNETPEGRELWNSEIQPYLTSGNKTTKQEQPKKSEVSGEFDILQTMFGGALV